MLKEKDNDNELINTLKQSAEHALESISQLAAENNIDPIFDPLKAELEQMIHDITQLGDNIKSLTKITENAIENTVKKHPWPTLIIATGCGFLLGRLISK